MSEQSPTRHVLRMLALLQGEGRAVLRETMERRASGMEMLAGWRAVTTHLDAWLWLWETQGGPALAAQISEPELSGLMRAWVHHRSANRDRNSALKLNATPDPALPLADQVRLKEVLADYRRWLPSGAPADHDLEWFHLPSLVLLAHACPDRRPPPQGHIAENSVLGTLINWGDLSLVKWWVSHPAFTPQVLNTLTHGVHGQSLLEHHLNDPTWLRFWHAKGLDLHGPAGRPWSESPFFRITHPESLKVFLDAGFDPNQPDEQGFRVDDYQPGQVKSWTKLHAYAQEARFKRGQQEEAHAATRRHQFTRLVMKGDGNPWDEESAFFSDEDFARQFRKGPWPVWQEGPASRGVMEVLARANEERKEAGLRLQEIMKRWKLTGTGADNREGKEARRRHHDDTPDWVMAHVLTAGLSSAKDNQSRPRALLLPPLIHPEDLTDLFRTWLREGPHLAEAWPELAHQGTQGREKDYWSALRPAHAPLAAQLVAEGVHHAPKPNTAWPHGYLAALSSLWPHVSDPADQALMWGTLVLSAGWMDAVDLGWATTTPRQDALKAGTPALWRSLSQHPLWTTEGPKRSDFAVIEAAVRQAQAEDTPTVLAHRRRLRT